MNLIRWKGNSLLDPVREMERLQDEINRLFEFDRAESGIGLFDRAESPAIDVVERDDNYLVMCDLPGVQLSDLDVSAANNVLTIKGEKKGSRSTKGAKVYRTETWEGTFQRTVSLPSGIDAGRIGAELSSGTLTVTVPKREEDRPKRITVKVM